MLLQLLSALLVDPRKNAFFHTFCSILLAFYSYVAMLLGARAVLLADDEAPSWTKWAALGIVGSTQLMAMLNKDWYTVPSTIMQYFGFLPTMIVGFQIQ